MLLGHSTNNNGGLILYAYGLGIVVGCTPGESLLGITRPEHGKAQLLRTEEHQQERRDTTTIAAMRNEARDNGNKYRNDELSWLHSVVKGIEVLCS